MNDDDQDRECIVCGDEVGEPRHKTISGEGPLREEFLLCSTDCFNAFNGPVGGDA